MRGGGGGAGDRHDVADDEVDRVGLQPRDLAVQQLAAVHDARSVVLLQAAARVDRKGVGLQRAAVEHGLAQHEAAGGHLREEDARRRAGDDDDAVAARRGRCSSRRSSRGRALRPPLLLLWRWAPPCCFLLCDIFFAVVAPTRVCVCVCVLRALCAPPQAPSMRSRATPDRSGWIGGGAWCSRVGGREEQQARNTERWRRVCCRSWTRLERCCRCTRGGAKLSWFQCCGGERVRARFYCLSAKVALEKERAAGIVHFGWLLCVHHEMTGAHCGYCIWFV